MFKREWEYLWMNEYWRLETQFLDSSCSDIRYFRNAFPFFYCDRPLKKSIIQILINNYIWIVIIYLRFTWSVLCLKNILFPIFSRITYEEIFHISCEMIDINFSWISYVSHSVIKYIKPLYVTYGIYILYSWKFNQFTGVNLHE